MITDAGTATAVATSTIALLVAIISWGQWITNRERLKHELFDRRYDIYEKVAAFLADVLQSGGIAAGRDTEFLRETKKGYFVFGGDERVKNLISEIYKHAADLHALQAEAEDKTLKPKDRHDNLEKQREIKQWCEVTLASLESMFGKYLKLGPSMLRLIVRAMFLR